LVWNFERRPRKYFHGKIKVGVLQKGKHVFVPVSRAKGRKYQVLAVRGQAPGRFQYYRGCSDRSRDRIRGDGVKHALADDNVEARISKGHRFGIYD
jgi:hypothetical protein